MPVVSGLRGSCSQVNSSQQADVIIRVLGTSLSSLSVAITQYHRLCNVFFKRIFKNVLSFFFLFFYFSFLFLWVLKNKCISYSLGG